LTDAVGIDRAARMGEQHADLARLRQPHESAVVLQDQVVVDVIGRELDVPAAGQWAPLAADLRPRHVGQNGLPVGGGEELDDVCCANSSSTRFHSPVGMPDPMNNRTGWLPLGPKDGSRWNSNKTSRSIAHV